MARLLLRSPGVKGIWLASLLAASGCIYTDAINQAPSVTIGSVDSLEGFKGQVLTVHATARDDEDEPTALPVLFTVEAIDGQDLQPCDFRLDTYGITDFTANVTFYRTGRFSVRATTSDRYGTPSTPSNGERVLFQI